MRNSTEVEYGSTDQSLDADLLIYLVILSIVPTVYLPGMTSYLKQNDLEEQKKQWSLSLTAADCYLHLILPATLSGFRVI